MKAAFEGARFAQESEYGVTPDTPTWIEAMLEGQGLQMNDTPELVEVVANSHFPSVKKREVVAFNCPVSYGVPLYIGNCEELIKMGFDRNSDFDMNSYVWSKRDKYQLREANGCVVNTMRIEWSASELVRISLDMLAAKITRTLSGSFTSGPDVCTGMAYKGSRITLSINDTEVTAKESGSIEVANNVVEGPPEGDDFQRAYVDAGLRVVSGSFKVKMKSADWDALACQLVNSDIVPFAGSLTFRNNIGETEHDLVLTFPENSLRALSNTREAGTMGDTVMQTLEVVDEADPPVWTFPSAT
jgi:hypothetical protein